MRRGKPYIPPGAPGLPREAPGAGERAPRRGKARDDRTAGRASGGNEERREKYLGAPRPAVARARLLYQDEEILAYDKPAGLPVIAADGSRTRCLLDIATDEVRRRNPKGRAAVVHRIDRDTSGAVVFARSARAKKELMGAWDDIVAERRYVALVEGEMEATAGACDTWLKEGKTGFVQRAKPGERGAKRALTRWRVLGEGRGLSLLELFLETGRKHQIRVQLAGIGHPVVGDPRYGHAASPRGEGARPGRLCLHAASIELALPGREAMRIESPVPPEFAAALGLGAEGGRASGRGPLNAPRGGSSVSPSGARSGARPRPGAPRGKKPPSRP